MGWARVNYFQKREKGTQNVFQSLLTQPHKLLETRATRDISGTLSSAQNTKFGSHPPPFVLIRCASLPFVTPTRKSSFLATIHVTRLLRHAGFEPGKAKFVPSSALSEAFVLRIFQVTRGLHSCLKAPVSHRSCAMPDSSGIQFQQRKFVATIKLQIQFS